MPVLRWAAFVDFSHSHYLFEPCFARPGEGGVEARGKAIGLQHLTPIPQGESLAAVAQAVQAELDRAFAAKVDGEGVPARERFPLWSVYFPQRGMKLRSCLFHPFLYPLLPW
jgi:hypothetical protein